jgi:ABC-type branched-subunit amino acid transport system ATPase component
MNQAHRSGIALGATKIDELIDLMGLGAFRQKLTGELSTGSRRIVDLAHVLAQDPKVVMVDEPSGGVAQEETVCDEMVALALGGIIAQGTPEAVLEHPAVIESYLGDDTASNRSGAAAA